ncbi:TetR/AcrR family transcriptional regulator [Elusimicrobiota bacterium]
MSAMKEKRQAWTKNHILDHAWELIKAKGLRETSVEEIAAAAEVSVGSVYNYFGSKNGLLVALVEKDAEPLLKRGEAILSDPGDDPGDAIFRLIWNYTGTLLPKYSKPFLREIMAASFVNVESVGEEMAGLDELAIQQFTKLLEDLQGRKLINADLVPSDGAQLLYGIVFLQMTMYTVADKVTLDHIEANMRGSLRAAMVGWGAK